MTAMHTGGLLACLWLAAAWPAQAQQAQQTEDARDAKIARLEQTVQEGFFLIGDSNTWLRLGGYAKLDAIGDSGDVFRVQSSLKYDFIK